MIGRLGSERRLPWIVVAYLLVTGTILGYDASASAHQRNAALVVNVAARQRALAERFTKDVLLRVNGIQSDPQQDAETLLNTATALLTGGTVEAVQGADREVRIPPASGWKVIAKLEQERRLIAKLITTGQDLIREGRDAPNSQERILRLRIIGAQVGTITSDAVGEMTEDADATASHLVLLGVVLGLLGTLAALGMAFLIRRSSAQRAAQFRSLIHKASDLITVIDPDLNVLYASASAERLLGYPDSGLTAMKLSELIHTEDLSSVELALRKLVEQGTSTVEVKHRLRHRDGSWRHAETAATNLLTDPLVRGIVLNTRDVTERTLAEDELKSLQLEREKFLESTVQAIEQERKRVAAELHDGPVQQLTALDLRLERARRSLDPASAGPQREAMEAVQTRLREEIQGLRAMMSGLRPPVLDNMGLAAALKDHLAAIARNTGLEWSMESTLNRRLLPAQEIVLYRVAQEALMNVIKHAGANHVEVSLQPQNGHVVLEVRDDGVGFDPSERGAFGEGHHFGLIGMRERVEMAGGKWEIHSSVGSGSLIRARLPWEVGAP
jgi:PAS domain S-box-containing protein